MGEIPDWYHLIVEAKYLGVAPWELLAQPTVWRLLAQEAAEAEGIARKSKEDRAKRRAAKGLPA